LEQIAGDRKERWIRAAFIGYLINPPIRGEGKAKRAIPFGEWVDTLLGEKTEKTDGFQEGDGVKNAERILKKMNKKGFKRAATKEEIKKIKERDARRAKNK